MLMFVMGFTITSVFLFNLLIFLGFWFECKSKGSENAIKLYLTFKHRRVFNMIIAYVICFPVLIFVTLLKFLFWKPFKDNDKNI